MVIQKAKHIRYHRHDFMKTRTVFKFGHGVRKLCTKWDILRQAGNLDAATEPVAYRVIDDVHSEMNHYKKNDRVRLYGRKKFAHKNHRTIAVSVSQSLLMLVANKFQN